MSTSNLTRYYARTLRTLQIDRRSCEQNNLEQNHSGVIIMRLRFDVLILHPLLKHASY
jgi:hypothetical protein